MDVIIPRRNRRRAGGFYTRFADVDAFKAQLATLPTGNISNITAFQRSATPPPSGVTTVNVAAEGLSEILCWAVGTTVYWYSAGRNVYLPESAAYMFSWGANVRTIDLTGVRTAKTNTMFAMFAGDRALQSLDLSGFDTSNVADMGYMFKNCAALETLDLTTFLPRIVTNMASMFYGCTSLRTIYVFVFPTDLVSNSSMMFYNCMFLKGGSGTRYDSSHTDKTYARLDNPPNNPGYFTLKV